MKHSAKIRAAVLSPVFLTAFLPIVSTTVSTIAIAQPLRDPTIPPGEAGSPTVDADATKSPIEREPMTVVVRNGKPYVMWGIHLLAPGAEIDGKRLEKITETEIWLRDGKQRLKVPRFMPDIQIRPASP